MADNARYVFRASRDAHKGITRLFDFVHPTAISLWNLRWQVQGYLKNVPNADSRMLEARFASGSGIGAGSLKRAAVDTSWSEQLENFASFILINTISVFEDYTAALATITRLSEGQKSTFATQLQFPSSSQNRGLAQARADAGLSSTATGAITWDPGVNRRICEANVEDLLYCYRYFKEIRNAIAHNGARVGRRQLDALNAFNQRIDDGKIGIVKVPEHMPTIAVGDIAKVSYRGVIGFSEIVLHLIATYDFIFSRTYLFEDEILEVLQPDLKTWPTSERQKLRRFRKMFDRNIFPTFDPRPELVQFLKVNRLIPFDAGI